MNSELFSRLHARSFSQANPLWKGVTDFNNERGLEECMHHVETEFVATKDDITLLQTRATAFIEDIIELKDKIPERKEVLDFMQFFSSILVLNFITRNKIFTYSFDWIINAIDDKVSTEKKRDVSFAKIDQFIVSKNPFIGNNFFNLFCRWVHDLFYYSRSTGGHKEAGGIFLQNYLHPFCKMVGLQHEPEGVRALTQIATWCHQLQYKDEEIIVSECLFEVYNNSANPEIKKLIALQFCVADANYTDISKIEWCQILQKDHYATLGQHEPIQLMVNFYQHDINKLLEHFEEIINAIEVYKEADTKGAYPLLANYNSVRIYSILERSIIVLLQNGQVDKANHLIGAFFKIPQEDLIDASNCFIIPNDREGVLYCFESSVIRSDSDTIKNIPEITMLKNSFLGVANTLNDNKEFVLESPDREGVPDAAHSAAFVQAINGHFQFRNMLYNPDIANCSGYYLLYGTQLPLQNIMACEIGFTIPIVHSFRKPLTSRKIREVYIWQGDTLLSEYERIGLEEIFKHFDISVSFSAHYESSKDEFLKNYTDPKFDLVWIICHGQYFHHESHKSHLDLGSGIFLNIMDFPDLPVIANERRLLIIDACDGATTSLTNSPQSIGIGSAVIGTYQALLSHGWPVDNHSSLIMGLLLAVFLCEGANYSQAHYQTITTFRKGKKHIIEMLTQFIKNQDLLDRIENKDIDFDNFMFWGSLVYME